MAAQSAGSSCDPVEAKRVSSLHALTAITKPASSASSSLVASGCFSAWTTSRPPIMVAAGVRFVSPPRDEPYGKLAVFLDLEGNRWDLLGDDPRRRVLAEASPVGRNIATREEQSAHWREMVQN